VRPIELEGPDFPEVLSHIWSAFFALSSGRSGGFAGPNPISYQDIKAWMELTNNYLDPREVEAILMLDTVYMRVNYA